MKAKVNVLAKPHPYIFTLQLVHESYYKVGMVHESKGQRIGKAPSLHLHTTVSA